MRAAPNRVDAGLHVIRIEPAPAIPRRNDRRRPVLLQEEAQQRVAVETGAQVEAVGLPPAARGLVLLLGDEAEDAEGLEVGGERVGRQPSSSRGSGIARLLPLRLRRAPVGHAQQRLKVGEAERPKAGQQLLRARRPARPAVLVLAQLH